MGGRQLVEGDFELVERIIARLIDTWVLAARANKEAAEEIRERGMMLPVAEEATEQIGPAQEGAVGGRGSADDQMISSAGADVPAIDHEFFRAQSGQARFMVKRGGQ